MRIRINREKDEVKEFTEISLSSVSTAASVFVRAMGQQSSIDKYANFNVNTSKDTRNRISSSTLALLLVCL